MSTWRLKGVFASVVTPVDEEGHPLQDVLAELTRFLIDRKVNGLCVGGVVSEYPSFSLEERKLIISVVVDAAGGRVPVLSTVSSPTMTQTMALACHSAEAGCAALLVGAPHFFSYEQRDLETLFRKVFSSVTLPCLLYDLPAHTNPIEIDTLQRLLLTAKNLIGFKDASGETRYLPRLAMAREQSDFSLLIGDDRLTYTALTAGWDGAVSGAACLCPELVVKLYDAFRSGDRHRAEQFQVVLDELLQELAKFPKPWGLRVGLGVRGIPTGPLPMPLAPFRKQQITEFRSWLVGWLDRHRDIFS